MSLRIVALLCLFGLAALQARSAFALPAPMPEQELVEKSDLVAVVRVLSVTCTIITKDEKTGEELPSYLARLKVENVKKGEAKPGEEVIVTWRAVPKGIVGPWAVAYYPGEVVLTHLVKKSGGVSYGTTWWNGKDDRLKTPEETELPKTPGETLFAPEMRPEQRP